MRKFKITWHPDTEASHAGTEIIQADSYYVSEGDAAARLTFYRYDKVRGGEVSRVVMSVLSSQVSIFVELDEEPATDFPEKPLVKYPERLALFKVEFREGPDELIWAHSSEFENGRPPVPLCSFYATLQTGTRSLIRAIWSDRIAEITCIHHPEYDA